MSNKFLLVAGLRLERRTPAYETGDLANLSTPQQSLHQPSATVKPQTQQSYYLGSLRLSSLAALSCASDGLPTDGSPESILAKTVCLAAILFSGFA